MKTHITWRIETPDGKCPDCGVATILVLPFGDWKIAAHDPQCAEHDGTIEVHDEVSAHVCPECRSIVSLSLNTGSP